MERAGIFIVFLMVVMVAFAFWLENQKTNNPNNNQTFDFSISLSPNSDLIYNGSSVNSQVSASLISGTTQAVAFSCTTTSPDLSCSFNPSSCYPNCNSNLIISTSPTTASGTYAIVITGNNGLLKRNSIYNLIVISNQTYNQSSVQIPLSGFTQIGTTVLSSGSNGSITTDYQRNRAFMNYNITDQVKSITVIFKISGPSATQAVDVDGVVRQGVTIWPNYQNQCNQYFFAWRADSSKPSGTSVLGAQVVNNPGATMLSQCPGTGFTPFNKTDGSNAFSDLNINVLDGNTHVFKVVRLSPYSFQFFTDGILQFTASDPNSVFADSGLYGLRTDNVNVSLYYTIEVPSSVAINYCSNPGACYP